MFVHKFAQSASSSAAVKASAASLWRRATASAGGSSSAAFGLAATAGSLLLVPSSSTPALCLGFGRGKEEEPPPEEEDDPWFQAIAKQAGGKIQGAIDTGVPTRLSYGFISGYCSGLALKKAGKAAAGFFGIAFMALQTLNFYGYVTVDHSKIQQDVQKLLDLNQDGKIDQEDASLAMDKALTVLEFGLPSGTGFAAGFVGGLRSG